MNEENRLAIKRVKDALCSSDFPNVVTIWGAGASIKSGVPGGFYMLKRMQRDLKDLKYTTIFRNKLNHMNDEASRTIDSQDNKLSFEHVLGRYADIYKPDGLHEWLKQYIPQKNMKKSPPYFPTFAHEYCAHLVNSGLLKYFISLNFDEILESTMEDELGYGNFQVVASLSEFERLKDKQIEDWKDEYGMPEPKCFVFKPHGTISRGLSLRHLPQKVEAFEDGKRMVLSTVLKDSLVVFLGFGNYNEDFWLLFGETYSRGATDDVVIVDINPESVNERLPGNRHTKEILKYNGEIDEFFKELDAALHKDKEYGSYRKKPTRHAIRGLFFDLYSRKLIKEQDEARYREFHKKLESIPRSWFDMRIYELELLIYLLKTRGLFVELATADCLRIEKALKRCLELSDGELKENIEPSNVLESILNSDDNKIVSHCSVLDRLNAEALNTKWCFLLMPNQKDGCNSSLDTQFDNLCSTIAKKYGEWIKVKFMEQGITEGMLNKGSYSAFQNNLTKKFKELYQDFDVDITGTDLSTIMRFIMPTPIKSRKEFGDYTRKLLSDKKWNKLRTATVAAEWLSTEFKKPYIKPRDCNIDIISNLDMFTEKKENEQNIYQPSRIFHYLQMVKSIVNLFNIIKDWNRNTIEIRWYAFRNLQHHMTIVSCTSTEEPEEHIGATYFRRLGKNTSISPVYVQKPEDISEMVRYFDDRLVVSKEWLCDGTPYGLLFTAKVASSEINIKVPLQKCNTVESLIYWIIRLSPRDCRVNVHDVI